MSDSSARFIENSLTRATNPKRGTEARSGPCLAWVAQLPVELGAELSDARSARAADNPKRRVADVSARIRKLRVVEDVEKFDAKIESQILFDHGVLSASRNRCC